MTLKVETLRAEILALLKSAESLTDPSAQQDHFATELARAVDRYVRDASVEGVAVSLPQGLGTATQTGKGKLS